MARHLEKTHGEAVVVHRFNSERERLDAMGYTETDLQMTNFDGRVDDGFEAALRCGKVYGRHAAWNFNGIVWLDGDLFAEEVWVYKSPSNVIHADTLEDLMRAVNDQYGYQ